MQFGLCGGGEVDEGNSSGVCVSVDKLQEACMHCLSRDAHLLVLPACAAHLQLLVNPVTACLAGAQQGGRGIGLQLQISTRSTCIRQCERHGGHQSGQATISKHPEGWTLHNAKCVCVCAGTLTQFVCLSHTGSSFSYAPLMGPVVVNRQGDPPGPSPAPAACWAACLSLLTLACNSVSSRSLRRAASASSVLRFRTAWHTKHGTHDMQAELGATAGHAYAPRMTRCTAWQSLCLATEQRPAIACEASAVLQPYDLNRHLVSSPAACCAWPDAAAVLRSASVRCVVAG